MARKKKVVDQLVMKIVKKVEMKVARKLEMRTVGKSEKLLQMITLSPVCAFQEY